MTSAAAVQAKGLGIRSALEWIQRTRGKAAADEVLAAMPEAYRVIALTTAPSQWQPAEALGALFVAFAQSRYCSPETLESQFKSLGTYVAETNLTTIYRVMLTFVKPGNLARQFPRLWGEYFRGLTSTVEQPGLHRARNLTGPLNAVPYIAPVSTGWIEFAYRHVGARHAEVRELNFTPDNPAPETLDIRVEWR